MIKISEHKNICLKSKQSKTHTKYIFLLDEFIKSYNKKIDYKRIFDIIFALFILIFFSPVHILITIVIAISSGGSIFFIQQRIGKNFQPFYCIKFRTMVHNADQVLNNLFNQYPHIRKEFRENFKLKNDPRITPIGRFLRCTSLDEFPQFWNVLKGEMSIVGPRPLVPEEIPMYGKKIDQVLKVKPGITGLWQVSGRNNIPYKKRICIDVYYAQNQNIWLDFQIILKTIWQMIFIKNNGAY